MMTRKKMGKPDPAVGTMAYWLMTPFGALYPASVPPSVGGADVLQVRARGAEYIDKFRELYCQGMEPTVASEHLDYQYRALVDRQALADAVARLTLDVDSQKMKPTAFGKLGLGGKLASDYHDVLNALWSRMLDLGEYKWRGSNIAKPDPDAPVPCCDIGHLWPVSNGKARTVVCRDCGSRKTLASGKITYPKSKVAP